MFEQFAGQSYIKVHSEEEDKGAATFFKCLKENASDLCRKSVVEKYDYRMMKER